MYEIGQDFKFYARVLKPATDFSIYIVNSHMLMLPEETLAALQHAICNLVIIIFVTNLYFFTDLKKC